MRSRSNRVL